MSVTHPSTGCAALHPWLQPVAPLGREKAAPSGRVCRLHTLPRVALRSTRGYNPSPRWGERKPPLRGGCAKTRTLPRVAHRPLCSGRCFTRGYNPPPRWGGSVNSRPFPRVGRRAAVPPRRSTRGDTPHGTRTFLARVAYPRPCAAGVHSPGSWWVIPRRESSRAASVPGWRRVGWPERSGGRIQDLAAGAGANSPQKSSAPTYG